MKICKKYGAGLLSSFLITRSYQELISEIYQTKKTRISVVTGIPLYKVLSHAFSIETLFVPAIFSVRMLISSTSKNTMVQVWSDNDISMIRCTSPERF